MLLSIVALSIVAFVECPAAIQQRFARTGRGRTVSTVNKHGTRGRQTNNHVFKHVFTHGTSQEEYKPWQKQAKKKGAASHSSPS